MTPDLRASAGRPALDPPAGVPLPARLPDAPPPGTRLTRHGDTCLVCGAGHPGGLRARLFAGAGASVYAEVDITDAHQGQAGMAHGGLLAAAFDEIMGAVNWLVGPPTVTGRLDIVYRARIPTNRTLHFRAWSLGVERRKSFVAGECWLDSATGILAASASAVFIRPSGVVASR
ncbi:MAG: PaaI family thioesterase [Jatrophihabitans sp.]|nr:MAG: PaaI family thioesterase [Jatrophihabitans sp.]